MVSYVSGDKNGSLINQQEPTDKFYVITVQTPDETPAAWCVKKETVINAFRYFYDTKGDLNPNLHWDCV
ncbi:hypothetical protein JQC72_15290 [Polycladomyces sp. WAk]|uniref:Uncharacterized protein n=1 Tax=Polycladomyces zharkentensis TaxID=2807616 RepID=A0ABS2WMS9_9BACL|nr:hypothetical protein [Polycladomyces sp. WAk]MBN2910863.1 hypothetical protein [Polycladomyces sp. WAk]